MNENYHVLVVDNKTGKVLQSIPCRWPDVDHIFMEVSWSERENDTRVYVPEWG